MATADLASSQTSGAGAAAKGGSNFLTGFNRLNVIRQAGLLVGLAASIALGFSVVLWSQREEYQPVYPSLQGFDVSELAQVLEAGTVPYRIDPASGVLLVPADQVAAVRLEIAAAGISRDNGFGYEFMDQEASLGTSQFMEENRYKRSLEGELQRTITNFRHVQAARVHLATPERTVFVRDARKPTASVFLTLLSGRQLTDTQVQAISNLVASSVPNMDPVDVTVVDQAGNLLSRRDDNPEFKIAGEQFEYVRRYEETLVSRVNRILMPLLGSGRFTAEVAADIDFTRTEQAAETYSPETAVLRSEQSMDERRAGGEIIAGIPGALSNQPPAAAQAPETLGQAQAAQTAADNTNVRSQATRNYEIDRTISYITSDPVTVRRLSIAVVIDEPEGEGIAPWTPEDIERITALVRDAVGYSVERGDSVTVINKKFAQPELTVMEELPIWQQSWFAGALRQGAGALFVLILVFGVLMPVLRRLSAVGTDSRALVPVVAGRNGGDMQYADVQADGSRMSDDSVTLSGGDDLLLSGPTESYERQLSTIKGLVAQDPARVAQVVKNWIANDV
ncbi:MAG: flagellar basal-body MS-ring/collar protein FliF [Pseudohongiella sp.]|nr:flagellar basal-body MS-ring/collar protein FliF [Pseudohongiella sp.]